MNANAIVMTPEQFEEMKRNLKNELIHELSKAAPPIQHERAYSAEWISVRDEIEHKLRGDYNAGCGQWYANQTGLYAAFRLAFRQDSIKSLRKVEHGRLMKFHNELFGLIDKYREGREDEDETASSD
ncbi:hypothetical protein ACM1RC_27535 [Paenibacillus azoreducens]|uniref:hypothetical protein n=1 Tax=Paenibacillus azoreducens TaxID=116718 RepID=UPI0039F59BE7